MKGVVFSLLLELNPMKDFIDLHSLSLLFLHVWGIRCLPHNFKYTAFAPADATSFVFGMNDFPFFTGIVYYLLTDIQK